MEKVLDARLAGSPARQDEQDAEQNGEIDGLRRRHQELERRLAILDGHLALGAAEQIERARLKKEKLLVKDRLLALTHPH